MINGSRVIQARELHRWTQGQLLEDVPDLTQSRLSRVEQGQAVLDENSLEAVGIAAATGVTTAWLVRPSTRQLEGLSPHFRKRSRTPERTKATGLAWAELLNEAYDLVLGDAKTKPTTLVTRVGMEPRQAARELRQELGFPPLTPLPYLVLALERAGVRVLGLPWTCDGIDAFCAWAGERPTVALVAGAPGDRRRWTVAHEVAHLLLHDGSQQGKEVEAEADAFAAELLTPLDAMRSHMPDRPTLTSLTMLKTQWGVSVKSLLRRARELHVVDDDRALSLYRQISARGWNKNEPGYVPLEKPRGLRKLVEDLMPGDGSKQLATLAGWSADLTRSVLAEHARIDELPVESAPQRAVHPNVVQLASRRR